MGYSGLSGEGFEKRLNLQHYVRVLFWHSPHETCADDLALQVFEHVPQEDKLRVSLVCKPWRQLLADPPSLWQTLSGKQAPACCKLHTGYILRSHNGICGSYMQL